MLTNLPKDVFLNEENHPKISKTSLYIGRFQPFHNGHLDAIEQILSHKPSKIIFGIGSSQEELTTKNPFTYYERREILTSVLSQTIESLTKPLGIPFEIVPVPDFETNEAWVDYILNEIPSFDTIYSGNPIVEMCFRELFQKTSQTFCYLDIQHIVKSTVIRQKIFHNQNYQDYMPKVAYQTLQQFEPNKRLVAIENLQNNSYQNIQKGNQNPTKINKILIIEKETRLEYLERSGNLQNIKIDKLKIIKNDDKNHHCVKKTLMDELNKYKISFVAIKDTQIDNINFEGFELVITLGGDGTILQTAKKITTQILVGINSEPTKSVGKLTKFVPDQIPTLCQKIVLGDYELENWDRLSVKINDIVVPFLALNEVLVSKPNIYHTSKLQVSVDQKTGYCLGNGIIVATQSGSSAFYKSSGGVAFEQSNFGYTMVLPLKITGQIDKSKIISKKTIIKISPKRSGHYVIFDCDENRMVAINDEDEVEIYHLDQNKLKVIAL